MLFLEMTLTVGLNFVLMILLTYYNKLYRSVFWSDEYTFSKNDAFNGNNPHHWSRGNNHVKLNNVELFFDLFHFMCH
jgi:hypothetical protein